MQIRRDRFAPAPANAGRGCALLSGRSPDVGQPWPFWAHAHSFNAVGGRYWGGEWCQISFLNTFSVLLLPVTLSVVLSGCTARSPLAEPAKRLTRSVALDSSVQSAFAKGRQRAMTTPARGQILRQNLLEQQKMWDSRATRAGMAKLLVHGRTVATSDAKTRPAVLDQNLKEQKLMWADPAKSRTMTMLAVDGRKLALKDAASARSMLQQNLTEQRAAVAAPNLAAGMSDVSVRLTQEALKHPAQAKTLRHATMSVMEGIASDSTERQRLLALMSSLMEDPTMKAKLVAMMKSMMGASASGGSSHSGSGRVPASKSSGGQQLPGSAATSGSASL